MDRTQGVGVIPKEVAIDYGLSGPNLRGSGVEHDLRKAHPYLVYEQLEFEVPVGSVPRVGGAVAITVDPHAIVLIPPLALPD